MQNHQDSVEMNDHFNNIPLNALSLSNRVVKALEAASINTLDELLQLDINAIGSIKGIGDKALAEIIDIRRAAVIESRVSYDPKQLLVYIREQIPELSGRTDQEILNLDVPDVLGIYKIPYYTFNLPEIAKEVAGQLPLFGTPYPFFNILASIAHTDECRSVSALLDYIFRDFSEIEKRVLLINFDGKQRTFAGLGKKTGLSRERIRQIYQTAIKKFISPYQIQRQSGFFMDCLIILSKQREHYYDFLHHRFRGRGKERLKELSILVVYSWAMAMSSKIKSLEKELESIKHALEDELIE